MTSSPAEPLRPRVEVEVFRDLAALSVGAAELFARLVGESTAVQGRCAIALSGGSTPMGLYEQLVSPAWRDRVDWRACHVFWGDERVVPLDDPASNAGQARRALLEPLGVPLDLINW